MRFSLALSVALNLLLLTTIVLARVDPERNEASDYAAGPARPAAVGVARAEVTGADDLLAILERVSLPAQDLKPLLLGWLEVRYRALGGAPGPRYWEPGYSPARDELERRLAAESSIRAELLDLFGADAAADPAFAAVFRPLGRDYAFLGPAAQVSLQRQQLERLAAPPDAVGPAAGSRKVCRENIAEQGIAGAPSWHAAGLSEQEANEYRLRFSPLAGQLRESGLAQDEAAFREIFDMFRQLEQSSTPSAQAKARTDLRSRLGDLQFDRFWSVHDPFFRPIAEYLEGRGFPEHQVLAAYSIVNRSQEALLAAVGRTNDTAARTAVLQQVDRDQAASLTRLLGKEAAAGLEAAMNEVALQISQGSAAGC
jgi:hypothetical protein